MSGIDARLGARGLLRYVDLSMCVSKLALGTCVGSMRNRGTEAIPELWRDFPRPCGDWRLHVFEAVSSQTHTSLCLVIRS
jgi:hypothetical protein